jgi:glyoxylase-like metal-dependent hydrolase (beta-lactamase superfamily II)
MIARYSQVAAALITLALITRWTGTAQAQGSAKKQPPMIMHKLTDNLYEVEGGGGNVVVYTTSAGVVLVDDKNVGDANTDELLGLIKTVSDQPVKYVFITHYHADHIGGNERFVKMGAQLISHVTTAENISGPVWKSVQVFDNDGKFLREQPYNAASAKGDWTPIAPSLVFTDELKLTLGGKEVRARYFGPAHTGGDAFIFFPAERAIAVGDTMRPFCSICIDYHAGGSLISDIKIMDGLLKLPGGHIEGLDDFDIVIPGHGDVSDRAGLLEHRNKLVQMRDLVTKLKHEGKSYGEIAKVMMAEYKWEPEDRNLGQWTFPGMMKELK